MFSRLLSFIFRSNQYYHIFLANAKTISVYTFIFAIIIWLILYHFCNRSRYDYKNKHVIITGGFAVGSSGMGIKMANIYLNLGCNVTLVAGNEKKLKQVVNSLNQLYTNKDDNTKDRVCYVAVDITKNEATVSKSLTKCFDIFGDCDVLINCAGSSVAASFEHLMEADFKWMMDINVLGAVYVTRSVLAGMRRRGGGRIVFISSQLGQVALHGNTAYCASEYALRGLAEALQMEVKSDNIFVSVAYPPDIRPPGHFAAATATADDGSINSLIELDLTGGMLQGTSAERHYSADYVAQAIVAGSTARLFHIHVGLDGWLLKSTQPGMSPINNALEATVSIFTPSICRFIALFYLLSWDNIVYQYNLKKKEEENNGFHSSRTKKDEQKIRRFSISDSSKSVGSSKSISDSTKNIDSSKRVNSSKSIGSSSKKAV